MCVLAHIWARTIKQVEHQRMDAFEMWCWRRLLRVPLDCKDIQPVNPKGNPPWTFIGRTDGEAETPILWPPDAKNCLTGKDLDAGKDWRQKEKVGWCRGWDALHCSSCSVAKLCVTLCDPMDYSTPGFPTRLPCPSLSSRACSDSC